MDADYKQNNDERQAKIDAGICPDCGAELIPTGGCVFCDKCGFDLCGS